MLTLDAKRTALVLIDVQKGTLGFTLSPHTPADIVATSVKLAEAARAQQLHLVGQHGAGDDAAGFHVFVQTFIGLGQPCGDRGAGA